MKRRAVFLDRDGVINPNVYNPATEEMESPHSREDFELFPWVIDSLKRLGKLGYLLFLISNQPSYAKGKVSLEEIKKIHDKFHLMMDGNGISFTEYYYCYHHPNGVVPRFSGVCECRKPSPYFLNKAREEFGLEMRNCWLVGDRDTDIFCAQAAGVKTVLVTDGGLTRLSGSSGPDFKAINLSLAVSIIEEHTP